MKTTFFLIQDKYKLINQLGYKVFTLYTLYRVYNVQCTQCTNQLLETSSAVLCTYSTAKLLSHVEATYPPRLDLSPGGPERGQLTAHPTTRWEGPLSLMYNPFPSTEFPGLGGPRDCTPPKGGQCVCRNTGNTGNSP
jgi:hypothetical protein